MDISHLIPHIEALIFASDKPLTAMEMTELLNKHLSERPLPLTSHNKDITAEFNDLILKMLSKKPTDRPASLREFLSKFGRTRIYKTDPDPSAGAH